MIRAYLGCIVRYFFNSQREGKNQPKTQQVMLAEVFNKLSKCDQSSSEDKPCSTCNWVKPLNVDPELGERLLYTYPWFLQCLQGLFQKGGGGEGV